MKVTLEEVTVDNGQVLKNLVILYRYDLLPFIPEGPGSGLNRFGTINGEISHNHAEAVAGWEVWWQKPGELFAFLIQCDGRPAGFVTAAKSPHAHPSVDYRLHDFFVANKYRRSGVGRRAAAILFGRFPGKWEVGWAKNNVSASLFWKNVILEHAQGNCQDWVLNQGLQEEALPGLRFEIQKSG